MTLRFSSSQSNDPKYGNGRVYYDRLNQALKDNGLDDQITIRFFPDNQLGQEIDVANQIKLGVIDMTVTGASIFGNLVAPFAMLDLGYLWQDFPHQTRAFEAGAGKPLEDMLLKGANIRVCAWSYNLGARNVLCKTPAGNPETIANKKIRTLPNPAITEVLRRMGAAATPLAFGEVYTAMQAGVLDGVEHDAPTILNMRFAETAKYYVETAHIYQVLGSDDVARGLMVALAFFGAAGALARDETMGITFFVAKLSPAAQRVQVALNTLLVVVVSACVGLFALQIGNMSVGQTTGSGLPLQWTFYPMGAAGVLMTVLAVCAVLRHRWQDTAVAAAILAAIVGAWYLLGTVLGESMPDPLWFMLAAFVVPLVGGLSIGFMLALSALTFIWMQGFLPGVIFAQQIARGIDTFVLLAIPFFILVGYLMEANGMSAKLINLLERLVGRLRGGLNVVVVLSMVIFSGISGSKLADVAAVGTVLVPAARRSKQNPGDTVGLLAASAVMTETIPPCINLIILGFVANISIGGLFVAGLLPAALMAAALIAFVIVMAPPVAAREPAVALTTAEDVPTRRLWLGALPTLGLVVFIFAGFKSGFATATEISASAPSTPWSPASSPPRAAPPRRRSTPSCIRPPAPAWCCSSSPPPRPSPTC